MFVRLCNSGCQGNTESTDFLDSLLLSVPIIHHS